MNDLIIDPILYSISIDTSILFDKSEITSVIAPNWIV